MKNELKDLKKSDAKKVSFKTYLEKQYKEKEELVNNDKKEGNEEMKKIITNPKELSEMTEGMSVDEKMCHGFYLTHGMASNSYYGTRSLDLTGFARITIGGDADKDLPEYVENIVTTMTDGMRITEYEFMVRESDLTLLADNLRGCGEIYVDGWSPNIHATYLSNYES